MMWLLWFVVAACFALFVLVNGMWWYDTMEAKHYLDCRLRRDKQPVPERTSWSWRLFFWLRKKFEKVV